MFIFPCCKGKLFSLLLFTQENIQGRRGIQTHISQLPQHCKAILTSVNTAVPKNKKLGGFPCTRTELREENAVASTK